MKKIICFCSLFLFITHYNNAQLLSDQVITDTMSLRDARYALLIQLATINHHFFKDRKEYNKNQKDARLTPRFGSKSDPAFVPNNRDTVFNYLKNVNLKAIINHTPRSEGSDLWCSYSFDKDNHLLDKSGDWVNRGLVYKTSYRKAFYANCKTEDNLNVLFGKGWYDKRKIIDSILVDVNILYPVDTKVLSLPLVESETVSIEGGDYIRVIDFDDRYFKMEVSDGLLKRVGRIQCINSEGKRKTIVHSNAYPYPTDSMYSYASKYYSIYSELIDKIDYDKYKDVSELKEEYERLRTLQPAIKEYYHSTYLLPQGTTTIEYTYYSQYDSLQRNSVMARLFTPRKGDYAIITDIKHNRTNRGIVDLKGNWIIKPSFFLLSNVAGVFFKGKAEPQTEEILYKLDVTTKSMVPVGYTIEEDIDNELLIVKQDNKKGVVDKNGQIIVPIRFDDIIYDKKDKKFQVIDSDWNYYWYDTKGNIVDEL